MKTILSIIILLVIIALIVFLIWWFWPSSRGGCRSCQTDDTFRPMGTIVKLPEPVLMELVALHPPLDPSSVQVPTSFDSRDKWNGLISSALDQGGCGSCWAFSTATAISDRLRIKNPDNQDLRLMTEHTPFAIGERDFILNSLNPYDLVNCNLCGINQTSYPRTTQHMNDEGYCNYGCDGGIIPYAYAYVKNHGLHTLDCNKPISCNPTLSNSCPCNSLSNSGEVSGCTLYKITDFYDVASGRDGDDKILAIKQDIFTNGPVTIGFTVYNTFQTFFESNPLGVYTQGFQDTQANVYEVGGHAVDIVGWGVNDDGIEYWLVRNSWGVNWGDDGFFRIEVNYGDFIDQAWGARV